MRVLVTGAAGFLGQHICRELHQHGHEVLGVDRYDGDLGDPGWFSGYVRRLISLDRRPDVVLHLAAKVGRLHGEQGQLDTLYANAAVTVLVAQVCGEHGIRLAYASTSEVYGDQGDTTCHEHGPMRLPHNLYGLTKRFGEELCQLYAPNGLLTLRFSMPYGPGHPPGKGRAAVTNFLWQAHTRQPIPVHRGAERAWCWVGDTVRGVRMVLERGEGAYNVGRDDNPTSLYDCAALACEIAGAPKNLIQLIDPPSAQTVVKRLSTDRLRQLGWAPQVGLEEGMGETFEWLVEHDREEPLVA